MTIDADLSDQIKEIARKCMMTETAVLSKIVREALPYVKLTERRVYDKESVAQAPARRVLEPGGGFLIREG